MKCRHGQEASTCTLCNKKDMECDALRTGLAPAAGDPDVWSGDPFAGAAKKQGAAEYACENPECSNVVLHLVFPAVPPGWWWLHDHDDTVHIACGEECAAVINGDVAWQQRPDAVQ